MPTGPEAGGAVVGLVTIDRPRSPRPVEDEAERVDRPLDAERDRLRRRVVDRAVAARPASTLMPRAPCWRRRGHPQRDGDVLGGAVRVDDADDDLLAGEGAEVVERVAACRRRRSSTCRRSTETIASPARARRPRPAIRARPRRTRRRRRARPTSAMPVKIANASSRFIVTPASRIPTLIHSLALANECGSASSLPSSPSSFTKPPIGSQLSVYRVAPASASSARARGEERLAPRRSRARRRAAARDRVAAGGRRRRRAACHGRAPSRGAGTRCRTRARGPSPSAR